MRRVRVTTDTEDTMRRKPDAIWDFEVDSTDKETDNLACGGHRDVPLVARHVLRRREK